MAFFRQVIAPFLILLVFLFALLAVSIRSFLPADMAAPAPIEEDVTAVKQTMTEVTSTATSKRDSLVSSPGAGGTSSENRN